MTISSLLRLKISGACLKGPEEGFARRLWLFPRWELLPRWKRALPAASPPPLQQAAPPPEKTAKERLESPAAL